MPTAPLRSRLRNPSATLRPHVFSSTYDAPPCGLIPFNPATPAAPLSRDRQGAVVANCHGYFLT
ncbi:MAG: hypothetical protein ACRD9L_23455, partial [Bryobacteraceae bacterium]